jgi:acetyltransferase
VDIIGDAAAARYAEALAALVSDREIDAILVLNCPTALADPTECAHAVVDTIAAAAPETLRGRNLFTAWLGEYSARRARQIFAKARVATFETPDGAAVGFMHRVRHRRNRELLMETPPARNDAFAPNVAAARQAIATAIAEGKSWLDPIAVGAVLTAYGIPLAVARVASDPGQAAVVAAQIGFPVALKIFSPDIVHKSDVGGLALDLGDPDEVRRTTATMLEHVRAARPGARLDGVLVQRMIRRRDAVELLAGVVDDPVFGALVAFGQGGTAVEIMLDSSLELPPLNRLLAQRLMARTRVWQLLQAYRGRPPADIEAVSEVLIRIGQLAADHPEIRELDINPLLADVAGVIALDARVRITPSQGPAASRLAIAPYPQLLATGARLRDGTALELRPMRPEDEPSQRFVPGR